MKNIGHYDSFTVVKFDCRYTFKTTKKCMLCSCICKEKCDDHILSVIVDVILMLWSFFLTLTIAKVVLNKKVGWGNTFYISKAEFFIFVLLKRDLFLNIFLLHRTFQMLWMCIYEFFFMSKRLSLLVSIFKVSIFNYTIWELLR